MKVITGLHRLKKIPKGSVVTVGVFDGLHAGHKKVIKTVVSDARRLGAESVVVTFDPHPAAVLGARSGAPSLISLKHRVKLIGELGVDRVLVIKFTGAFAGMSAEKFVANVIAGPLGAREVCIGGNFYFGKGQAAGVNALRLLGRRYGFKVKAIGALRRGGHVISSSRIRRLIGSGELARAAKLLARPVSILGTVVRGARFGRQLGYPTANLNPHHEVIPPSGVYAVRVYTAGRGYGGVLNIGTRPTFYAPRDREPSIEAHIFGFRGNIYGKDIEVEFVRKIRDEKRFGSADELVKRIKKDSAVAAALLAR